MKEIKMFAECITAIFMIVYVILWVTAAVTLECAHVISFVSLGSILFLVVPIVFTSTGWRMDVGRGIFVWGELYIMLMMLPPTSLLLYQSIIHHWKSCMNFELVFIAEIIIMLLYTKLKKRSLLHQIQRENDVYYFQPCV